MNQLTLWVSLLKYFYGSLVDPLPISNTGERSGHRTLTMLFASMNKFSDEYMPTNGWMRLLVGHKSHFHPMFTLCWQP